MPLLSAYCLPSYLSARKPCLAQFSHLGTIKRALSLAFLLALLLSLVLSVYCRVLYWQVALNTCITDPVKYLRHIVSCTNMACLTHIDDDSGDCGFLAANLYAKSIFGEDALVNVSIEKQVRLAMSKSTLLLDAHISRTSLSRNFEIFLGGACAHMHTHVCTAD